MNQGISRTLKLLGAMGLGLAIPAAHEFQFLIRYAIMAMLWLAFLDIRPAGFRRQHFFLLAANWAIGLTAWALIVPFNRELALAALLIGLTPTATASPVVTGMLGGRVEFVAGAVLLTNVSAGCLFPLVLPHFLGTEVQIPFAPFLRQTAIVVLLPLLAAQLFRVAAPGAARVVLRYRSLSFYLWMGALFLITSNASHFLLTQWHAEGTAHFRLLGQLALTAAAICAINFALGWKLGGSGGVSREVSQSLGQKNTMLTIWIALLYANPLVALGPTFYVLCHNSYNAWQLARGPVRGGKDV